MWGPGTSNLGPERVTLLKKSTSKESFFMGDSFRQTLEQIAALARQHPEHEFEGIQSWVQTLHQGQTSTDWVETLESQWQALPEPRQDVCQQIFAHALLRARQATYQPLNALDAFLERYLYGVQDEQIVQKSAVSQTLKQIDESQRRAPVRTPQHPHQPAAPPPRAGRTHPLPPTRLPEA